MDIVVPAPTNLLAIRDTADFYPQDWYEGHAFATRNIPAGVYRLNTRPLFRGVLPDSDDYLPTAALCAWAWVLHLELWRDFYVWTRDYDDFGQRVYVGLTAGDGKGRPGFQVHRHLTIDDKWGLIVCAGS